MVTVRKPGCKDLLSDLKTDSAPDLPDAAAEDVFQGHFSALRHRNFRIFYVGHLLSLSGTWLQVTAIGWLVLELTDSEAWLGAVSAATSVPILFLSLYAGFIADRFDKRKILIIAQSVACVQAMTLATLSYFGVVSVGWIVLLALVLGIANSFEIPTRQSFFVELVGERDLTNAIALNSAAFNATRMIGPAIAGATIAAVGVTACFAMNGLSYLAVVAGLLAIRRPPPAPPLERVGAGRQIWEGVIWIWEHPTARTVVTMMSVASILVFPYTMLLPVFARDILQVGPQGLGWLYSATGAGALTAGLSFTALTHRFARGRLLIASGVGLSVMVAGFALSPFFWLSLAFLAGAGFFMILSTANANTLIQMLVTNEIRGRVMAVYVVLFLGVTPLGYLLAGSLAGLIGAPLTLAMGCAVFVAGLITSAVRLPCLRAIR